MEVKMMPTVSSYELEEAIKLQYLRDVFPQYESILVKISW